MNEQQIKRILLDLDNDLYTDFSMGFTREHLTFNNGQKLMLQKVAKKFGVKLEYNDL